MFGVVLLVLAVLAIAALHRLTGRRSRILSGLLRLIAFATAPREPEPPRRRTYSRN